MRVLIGNVVALAACIVMLFDGYARSRKRALQIQVAECMLHTAAALCVGAVSGAVVNAIAVPRNVLAYRDRLTTKWKAVFIIATAALILGFNADGWLGLLPLAASIEYILLMDRTKGIAFKAVTIGSVSLWLIYDTCIRLYVSAVFDALFLAAACVAIYRIKKHGDPDLKSTEKE